MYLSPAQTTESYDPADGTTATVGHLKFADLLLVSSKKGAPGELHGMVTNTAGSDVKLTVRTKKSTVATLTIPAETAVRLDGKTSGNSTHTVEPVNVKKVTTAPGEAMPLLFQTQKAGTNSIDVPVLLDQGVYGTASPTHAKYTPPKDERPTEPNG